MKKFFTVASVIVTSVMVLSACNSANSSNDQQSAIVAKANTSSSNCTS
jgi:nitrite reductase (NO-forming)